MVPEGSGEFALIDTMVSMLPGMPASVRLGPGDDAAVTDPPRGAMVAAADLLVEGRHFDLAFSSAADVGSKAISANVSDLAAMGAVPLYGLVSIGLPEAGRDRLARGVYEGIAEGCAAYGIAIIGGDTVAADLLTVSVAVIGEADATVSRSGAKPGDVVCVTGSLGGAAAGLMLLRAASDPDARELLDRFPELAQAHRRPTARVAEGLAAREAGANAMIDVSDGLASDAGHIADKSGVALTLDFAAVPVASGVPEAASFLGVTVEQVVLTGGDDYELVLTIAPDAVDVLREAIAPTPLTVIGSVEQGSGLRDASGAAIAVRGWDHFAR